MRVLVLGGTGFIGPPLVRLLLDKGHEVAVFNRGKTADSLPAAVQRIRGELGQAAAAAEAWARFDPEVAVFMTPWGEADTQQVSDALVGIADRVVGLSSCDVYRALGRVNRFEQGPPEEVPLKESAALRQRHFLYRDQAEGPQDWRYGYEKILAERVLLGNPDLPATVLRLPAIYGAGDPMHRLFPYLKRMDDGRPAILLDRVLAGWRWCRGHVENVAAAIALAVELKAASGRVYNVADPQALTEAEWVRQIGWLAGWQGEVVEVGLERLPKHLRQEGDFSQDLSLDSGLIRHELGYAEKLAPDQWLARAIAWQRDNPPAPDVAPPFDYAAEDVCLAIRNRGRSQ